MIRTVGHGTASAGALVDLLHEVGVRGVVDVRRYPGSRRHPQFGRDALATWLSDAGVDYRWIQGLGGRRRVSAASANVALRNPQFRAYADYMATEEFAESVRALLVHAESLAVAVMCSESVWWRCHRRLLADHLVLVEEVEVGHVFHDGRVVAHPVTPGARRAGGLVVYDGR